jgi:hypothetical protein
MPLLLIQVVVILLVAGVLLWAIQSLPWIDAAVKQVIRIVIIVILAIWLIYLVFGFATVPVVRR